MSEGGQEAVRTDEDGVAVSRARELEQQVRELERLLGRKTLEVEVLKEALAAARGKARLEWRHVERPRTVYYAKDLDADGWLRPASLRYLETPPAETYVQVRRKATGS